MEIFLLCILALIIGIIGLGTFYKISEEIIILVITLIIIGLFFLN